MAYLGMEPIVEAATALIKANIDTKLTAVEAIYAGTDPITLPRPNSDSYFYSDKVAIQLYPVVCVMGTDTNHNDFTGHDVYAVDTLIIRWEDKNDDPEVLQKIIYRSARALCQIFFATSYDLSGNAITGIPGSVRYMASRQLEDSFQQAVEVVVTAQTEEGIP